MLKSYTDANGLTIIDSKNESETGGEPRKLGLLEPLKRPELYAALGDVLPLLTPEEIRKALDNPDRFSGRKLFGPQFTKDQDGRGACNGYARVGVHERAMVRRGLEWVKLSGDFAYSQMNNGRDGGSHLDKGMELMGTIGDCTEETVKRLGLVHEYRASRFPKECTEEAQRFKGHECYYVDTEQELLTAMVLGFDCVVAVQAGGSGGLDKYGICQWGNGSGNHAVLVDDAVYDTKLGGYKFDHQNSWGTRWNDQGRSYLTFDRHFKSSVRVHRFYAIRSTGDDPQGENPPTPKP